MNNIFFNHPNDYYSEDYINVICDEGSVASNIRRIIDGEVSVLIDTFTWGWTKEGYYYWCWVHGGHIKLDDEVMENLTRKAMAYILTSGNYGGIKDQP
ncbi:MAG: hypothetical protein E6Q97_12190 [Desulfurellales bacterium]|nr:MAG: hypothetical protein E6Q97_12190 [Desulfurellales bacterium]